MHLPVLLAQAQALSADSPVSLSLAWTVGGAVIVLTLGLAEARFRIGALVDRVNAQDKRIDDTEKANGTALADLRGKQHVMELSQAENKVLMSEVRTRLDQQADASKEQTRMLHELLSMGARTGGGRRQSDAA